MQYFFARETAEVFALAADEHRSARERHARRVRKVRIGEAVAEGKAGLFPEGVEIAVTHIDAFREVLLLGIAVFGKSQSGGKIGKRFGPARREPARRRDFAEQKICKRAAARLPALPQKKEGVYGELVEEGKIDKSPHVDDDADVFIVSAERLYVFIFHVVEAVVCLFVLAVCPLPRLAGDDIEGAFRLARQIAVFHGDARGIDKAIVRDDAEDAVKVGERGDLFFDARLPCGILCGIVGIIAVEPSFREDGDARSFEPFLDADNMAGMHRARARAARDRLPRARAVERQLFTFQGEHPLVLQEHDALPRRFPREFVMQFFAFGNVGRGRAEDDLLHRDLSVFFCIIKKDGGKVLQIFKTCDRILTQSDIFDVFCEVFSC